MTITRLTALAAAATLCCTLGFSAHAQSPTTPSDKQFLTEADEGNSAEIAASKMALKKSHNPDVKAYAQQMITDHMKLRSDMTPFAQKLSVTAPQPLNEEHQELAK